MSAFRLTAFRWTDWQNLNYTPIIVFESKNKRHCDCVSGVLPSSLLFRIWHQLNKHNSLYRCSRKMINILLSVHCPVSGTWMIRQWFTRSSEILECFTIKHCSLKPIQSETIWQFDKSNTINLTLTMTIGFQKTTPSSNHQSWSAIQL